MPIYEYECSACGHRLEAMQKINDKPKIDCPECGQSKLKKLISAVGFRLKGSGWYETDFKQGNKKNVASSDSTKPNVNEKSTEKDGKKAADKGAKASSSKESKPSGHTGSKTQTRSDKK